MSLYLGTTLISGVATGDAAVTIIEKGSEVTIGETTLSATGSSITITDIIGKDNVALMYMDSGSCPASAMENAGLVNVIVQGELHFYNIHYCRELCFGSNDGFIIYDKTTGNISIASNMSYNERFIAGKYMYVAW